MVGCLGGRSILPGACSKFGPAKQAHDAADNTILFLGKRVVLTASACFVLCVGLLTQGGHSYLLLGVGPSFEAGVAVGVANLPVEERSCWFDSVATGTPASFSVGRKDSNINLEDWEVDFGIGVGAGWSLMRAFGYLC